MYNPLRTLQLFCILLLIGLAVGCGNDDPVEPYQPPVPQSAGTIGVYSDPEGNAQYLTDVDGYVTVYVVHKVEDGATGASFRIQAPSSWTRVSVESQYPVVIGDIDDGISIGYGACRSGAIHLVTMTYQSNGDTPEGAMFRVLPHNQWPDHVQVVDCEYNMLDNGRGLDSPVVQPQEATGSPNVEHERPSYEQ
jgi:hypothetical protein